MNYKEADKQLGNRNSLKLQNNTYLKHRDDNAVAILLHKTDVVTFNADGTIILDSGGWQTVTTRNRLNSYLPFNLYIKQIKGIWYINEIPFYDKMVIGKRGKIAKSVPFVC